MWALGIIMFICVTGKHPFIIKNTITQDNIIKNIPTLEEEE